MVSWLMLPWHAELSQLVEEERTSLELEEELTRQIVDELEAEITDEQAALQQLVDGKVAVGSEERLGNQIALAAVFQPVLVDVVP